MQKKKIAIGFYVSQFVRISNSRLAAYIQKEYAKEYYSGLYLSVINRRLLAGMASVVAINDCPSHNYYYLLHHCIDNWQLTFKKIGVF